MQLILSQFERLRGLAQTAESWSVTASGRYLLAREDEHISLMTEEFFGYYALQLGDVHRDMLAASPITTKVKVGRSRDCAVHSELHSLPFESSTVDLVVISHALEFSSYPEAVMRESFRVLRPEGRLLIVGFNPVGMYGWRWRLDASGGYPWHGEFIRPSRIKDWFAVLGMAPMHGAYVGYAPPLGFGDGLSMAWEEAGDRWWPLLGGVYILQAVKRLPAMRRLKPRWSEEVAEVGAPAGAVKRGRVS